MASATITPVELQGLPSHVAQAVKNLQATCDDLTRRLERADTEHANYQSQLQAQVDALRSENRLLKSQLEQLRSLGTCIKTIVAIVGELNG